ncbi:MAG: hypothetical protein HGB19_01305 [Chlorobiales bacterium]|jgi:hypothetical protein|nr:hypothetical protein [Chlorobiales bacterium]
MFNKILSKEFIERSFLTYYASGHSGEFFLADNYHNLSGFPTELLRENSKKLKDVAVSLVHAGFIKGSISGTGKNVSVNIHGITPEGRAYLKSR